MNEKRKRRKGFSLKGLKPYYIFIGIIIILLTVILVFINTNRNEKVVISEYEYIAEPDSEPSAGDSAEVKPAVTIPGPGSKPDTDKAGKKPELVFVIDDVGNSIEQLKPFLAIPFPITFAIMPDRKYTTQCAAMIKAAGKEYILHQPMEAIGKADPGESAIFTGMNEADIFQILDHNFSQLPSAGGMNNHMGSAVTSDLDAMNAVMNYLLSRNLFFLDSYTISGSLAGTAAGLKDVRYAKRNSMFLDNENDKESIRNAIEQGRKTARKTGHAVMIGHVMTGDLAQIMLELYPSFIEDGFSLKEISELFIEMNNPDIAD